MEAPAVMVHKTLKPAVAMEQLLAVYQVRQDPAA
jgi:hypothetical protein